MKKIVKGAISVLLTVALGLPVFSMAACAEEVPTVEVPVTIGISSTYKPSEEYKVTLTAANASCPMPEGTTDGTYTAAFTGEGNYTLCQIAYPKLGIYNYTIRQEKGSNSRGTYDATEYNMRVAVTNAENGGLATTMIVYVDNVNQKSGAASFTNSYASSGGGGSTGGGGSDGGGGSRSGGTSTTTITDIPTPLSNMDPIDALTGILDGEIPLSALPQTGTLWWMVQGLLAAGVLMFAVGFYKIRRRNEEDEI